MDEKKEIVVKDDDMLHSKEKVLRRSIAEGSSYSFAEGLSTSYITPFALAIGASTSQIGFLSSFSALFQPLGQLWGSVLMEKFSRKKIVLTSIFIQTFLWLPIIALILLFHIDFAIALLPLALVILYTASVFAFGIRGPSFFSWMGDIVDGEKGRFFAKRNQATMVAGMVSFLLGAFLLDFYGDFGKVLMGFGVLFAISLVARLIARSFFLKIPSPDFKLNPGYYFSFKDFVKRYDNFGKFSFYQAFLYFALMISSPFFAVYMLKDLNFSYTTFTLVTFSPGLFYFIFSPFAGKFSDRYGNVKLLYVSALLFPIVPLLWSFIQSPAMLVLFPGAISGAANAAFVLAVTNFTYDSVSTQKRGLCVAYSGLLTGIGIFFGSILGGFLIQYLNFSFMSPMVIVFFLSGILMMMASLFFLPQIKEVRNTDSLQGFSVDFIHHPFKSIASDIVWFKNFIHGK